MVKDLFDTEEKKENAIAAFQGLLEHPGWKLIEQIEDANIEILREQLETETEDQKLEDVRIMRNNLRLTKEFRNTPQNIIEKLQKVDQEVPNPDPYPDVKNPETDDEPEET